LKVIAIPFAAYLQVATSSVSLPTPSPAPLPVIVTVKSSVFCTLLRSTALPVGYVVRVNQGAVAAMADDTVAMFSPAATVAASDRAQDRLRQTIFAVTQNLTLAENILNRSWSKSPKGSNADVDAMRQRLQNLVDLQRSLIEKYQQALEWANNPCLTEANAHSLYCIRESSTSQMLTVDGIRALMRAGLSDQLITPADATDPEHAADKVAHDVSRYGTPADIDRQLTLQELAFDKEMQGDGKSCGI
jgi:hypothetical protein